MKILFREEANMILSLELSQQLIFQNAMAGSHARITRNILEQETEGKKTNKKNNIQSMSSLKTLAGSCDQR